MSDASVVVEQEKGIAVVTLNRPDAMNALNGQLLAELNEALHNLDEATQAVILTGAGDTFCAGADLSKMQNWTEAEAVEHARTAREITNFLETDKRVTVAAIDGYCLGGGHEFALACDFRIATEDAVLGQPEVNIGTIPGFGGTARLARMIGTARAKSLVLSGKKISATEAQELGLVETVVAQDALLQETKQFVTDITESTSPLAYGHAKQLLTTTLDKPLEAALDSEIDAFTDLFGTHDQQEGIEAFLEKRDPEFTGE